MLAIDLGVYNEDIGEGGVRDPLFLTIQYVMGPGFVQFGSRFCP